jgi:tetratricopeptide (TPR) repeat protein
MTAAKTKYDFFVSRRGTVAELALEVATVLRSARYTVCIQDDSIPVGANILAEIHNMLDDCQHLIAIITHDYVVSPYTREEWANFVALSTESNGTRRLIPFRAEQVKMTGLFAGRRYVDLFGVADAAMRRKIILDAVGTPPRPASTTTAVFRGVPPRNPDFVGRGALLDQIHGTLNSVDRPEAGSRVALFGLAGIGKSSIAAEYAHAHAQDYAGIWWATAENRPVLIESLAGLAGVLDPNECGGEMALRHAGEKDPNHEELAKAALAKLAGGNAPWLLVYDNVASPDQLRGLIPSTGVRVLITTRWRRWAGLAVPIEVDVFEQLEALQLLLKLTGRPSGPGAVRLAKTLGYLPLALEQASAYMSDTAMEFDRYAARVDQLIEKAPKEAKYPTSVSATFNLAIEQTIAGFPAAEKLLDFLSVMAPEQIPRDLIDDTILSEDDGDEALAALHRASLIKYEINDPESGSQAVAVHRLVRTAMHQRLKAANRVTAAVGTATERLAKAFPDKSYSEPGCWPRCKQLLPHALSVREEAKRAGLETLRLAELLDGVGNYLLGRGAFSDAEPLFKEVQDIGQRILGPEHATVGLWLNNFGNLYLNWGRFDDAKEKYRKSISIGVQTLGRESLGVATRLGNLAYALMKTGQYDQAEAYYVEAIATLTKLFGREDERVAARRHKLANLYCETQRYAEAEPLYREAIAIGEKKLGRENFLVCDWIGDLANLLRATGRYVEAETLNREAIANLCRTVGPEYHRIAFIRENLAELLLQMGRIDDAYQEASQALKVQQQAFGSSHRWTKRAAEALEKVEVAQGRPGAAAQAPIDDGIAQRQAG